LKKIVEKGMMDVDGKAGEGAKEGMAIKWAQGRPRWPRRCTSSIFLGPSRYGPFYLCGWELPSSGHQHTSQFSLKAITTT